MDIRKRRRLLKPSFSSLAFHSSANAAHFFSLRTLFLSLFSFVLLLFLSHNCRVFHPTRIVPTLSLLSSSSASNSIQDLTSPATTTRNVVPELRIQTRILLPDALLVFLHKGRFNRFLSDEIDCVYRHALLQSERLAFHPALSAADYDEFRWMVRCPLPPANYSSVVSLDWHLASGLAGSRRRRSPVATREKVPNWDWAAYEAGVEDDGVTAVVFVKGLNLRPDKEYDPRQFRCRFQLGNSKNSVVTTTTAISAGQEVVRCPLPELIKTKGIKKNGAAVKVSIERPRSRQLLPSVARLYGNQLKDIREENHKYNLCACTMVWNQAAALREWVIYHAWLGVERWFIYDNNSDDGLIDEIGKLNAENYNITRHAWPWIKSQEAGFSQCVLRARKECSWVAFFDVDEFFYFPPLRNHHRGNTTTNSTTNSSNQSNSTSIEIGGEGALKALVNEYSVEPGIGEIRTKCHSFGPSGLGGRPRQGVTVGYTCRLQRPERHKSIIRPDAVDDTLLNAVHHFRLREGFVFQDTAEGKAVINHYKYQVWDVFKAKFSRRVSTYVADWQDNQNERSRDRAPGLGKEAIQPPDWRRWYCEVWDTGLRDFVVANFADPHTGLLPWEASVSL